MLGFFLVNVQFNLIYFDNNKFVTMDRTFIKVKEKKSITILISLEIKKILSIFRVLRKSPKNMQ